MNQSDKYKKFLLNRVSTNPDVVAYIENSWIVEEDLAKYSFHKILVCKWSDGGTELFETLSNYFGVTFVPVNLVETNVLTSFYTSSLMLVLKMLKSDFMFAHSRNMFSIDILLNQKTTSEIFHEKITIEDIITKVVSHRFNEYCELNLSNFCNDSVLKENKINFYKLSLLSYFKILMIRMGRDTKVLNLSSNNLSQVPLDILNFFIKGDLIGVNLSNNNIPSITELQRISSKVEKLWVEENPLCEDLEPIAYIRQISQKFPRLTELDGVPLNEHGVMMPFYKNYVDTPDKKTKFIVEKFVSLYYSHYDTNRLKLGNFYAPKSNLSISTDYTEPPVETIPFVYLRHSRNFLNPVQRAAMVQKNKRVYRSRSAIVSVLGLLPSSTHDTTTFIIDVLKHDNKCLILIIEGVFKDRDLSVDQERIFRFRRSFIFSVTSKPGSNPISYYSIVCDMFYITLATPEIVKNSFKTPIRNLNQLTLIDPDTEDQRIMCDILTHYTQLKKKEVEARLRRHNWDIREALKEFTKNFKNDKISSENFLDDDFSDLSSLLEDEID